MYFSRVELRQDITTATLFGQLMSGNGYAVHQLLWKLFPDDPGGKRDFIFRQEMRGGWPHFYLVSTRKPREMELFSEVVCKEYEPNLRVGERLAFSLRANPVVARKIEGRKHSPKHDVWMDAKREGRLQGLDGLDLQSFIENQVKQWLLRQGEGKGFSLSAESIEIQGYQQHRIYKQKHGMPIRYSSADFLGLMTVENPDSVRKVLFDGLGKAKGFGCGLLMVRRT